MQQVETWFVSNWDGTIIKRDEIMFLVYPSRQPFKPGMFAILIFQTVGGVGVVFVLFISRRRICHSRVNVEGLVLDSPKKKKLFVFRNVCMILM